MNSERRQAQREAGLEHSDNLISQSDLLKRREAWKYAALSERLEGRPHEFEFPLGSYVYDLALHDTRVLVEFDSVYHDQAAQMAIDARKDTLDRVSGYNIVRRRVGSDTVIDPGLIEGL